MIDNILNEKLLFNSLWIINQVNMIYFRITFSNLSIEKINILLIYIINLQVILKDIEFINTIVSLNAVGLFHTFLQKYYKKNKMLMPLLKIIKYLSKNGNIESTFQIITTNIKYIKNIKFYELVKLFLDFTGKKLIEDEIIFTVEEIFNNFNYTTNIKFRILLECYNYLTLHGKYYI